MSSDLGRRICPGPVRSLNNIGKEVISSEQGDEDRVIFSLCCFKLHYKAVSCFLYTIFSLGDWHFDVSEKGWLVNPIRGRSRIDCRASQFKRKHWDSRG